MGCARGVPTTKGAKPMSMRTANIDCAITAIGMTCSDDALLFVAELIAHIMNVPGSKHRNEVKHAAKQTAHKIIDVVQRRQRSRSQTDD